MTKKEKVQQEAVDTLKQWGLVDGSTVYAKVNKVSASGMSRNIGLYIAVAAPEGEKQTVINRAHVIDISYHAAKALEWRFKEGYAGGVVATGCGMDMLFATVDALSWAMGYGSLCQNRDQVEPEHKNAGGGKTMLAIGLKYRQL